MISANWIARFAKENQREGDHRSHFQRDKARILHSEAFRCLQSKTQIHAVGEDDFYRTRLTHSLEVAQIGSSLREKLVQDEIGLHCLGSVASKIRTTDILPSRSLIESLCFAHDIGHPPFGHGGESALHHKMQNDGGFEGNAQSFRIVTQLEPYTQSAGMNLTRRTLLGIIKYPTLISAHPVALIVGDPIHINLHKVKPMKGIYKDDEIYWDWVLSPLSVADRDLFCTTVTDQSNQQKTCYKSLDCSIMELADDIAYGVHDLEDAIVGGMITPQVWEHAFRELSQCQSNWIQKWLPEISQKLFSSYRYERKSVIGALVNYFVINVQWTQYAQFNEPLLRFNATLSPDAKVVLEVLKRFVLEHVIKAVKTQHIEYKGQRILMMLFDILSSDPESLLPNAVRHLWKSKPTAQQPRVISDYLASMSDRQAFKLYHHLV